ncbi:MAG: S-layer homology domain-containing protein, partial [Clostridia bacterium]|nr:S-layer homology domain-containing protein [Clostridia bacterium]
GTAYSYGIVNGKGENSFDPMGTITRQEASAMVARAAKLCGMDTELTDSEAFDVLAGFGDYIFVHDWAKKTVAFCYSEDILNNSDLEIRPLENILRSEIAQMLYNMLVQNDLI